MPVPSMQQDRLSNPTARSVLVINATFEPVGVVSARRAIKLVCKGAAIVQEPSAYVLHTSKVNIPLPSVIRLLNYRRIPRYTKAVSRKSILVRDGYTCQYCGRVQGGNALTLDHVMPRSRGGGNTWENLVACCTRCNNLKADRTPEEAGMELLKRPIRFGPHARHRSLAVDEVWGKYLYV